MLVIAVIVYKKLTSQKLKYIQFRLAVTKWLLDGQLILEHAR